MLIDWSCGAFDGYANWWTKRFLLLLSHYLTLHCKFICNVMVKIENTQDPATQLILCWQCEDSGNILGFHASLRWKKNPKLKIQIHEFCLSWINYLRCHLKIYVWELHTKRFFVVLPQNLLHNILLFYGASSPFFLACLSYLYQQEPPQAALWVLNKKKERERDRIMA